MHRILKAYPTGTTWEASPFQGLSMYPPSTNPRLEHIPRGHTATIQRLNVWTLSLFGGGLTPLGMWKRSSLIRDRTRAPCIGRWTFNYWTHQGSPMNSLF